MTKPLLPHELSVDKPAYFLDTETTGLDHQSGDKIVEIGVLEVINRQPTGRNLHLYINPERSIPEDAVAVHGLTDEFIKTASNGLIFKDYADEFLDFIGDSGVLAIHNAGFDMGFLDAELKQAGHPPLSKREGIEVFDTLSFANGLFPNKKNNLNALCKRYGVDITKRELHGALLDAELLTEVYLLMTQTQRGLFERPDSKPNPVRMNAKLDHKTIAPNLAARLVDIKANDEDLEKHEKLLDRINKESKGKTLWSPR